MFRHLVPRFVIGERLSRDHGHTIIWRRMLGKINADICIHQMRGGKWIFAHYVVQIGRAVRPHGLAVRQAKIKGAKLRTFVYQGFEHSGDFT